MYYFINKWKRHQFINKTWRWKYSQDIDWLNVTKPQVLFRFNSTRYSCIWLWGCGKYFYFEGSWRPASTVTAYWIRSCVLMTKLELVIYKLFGRYSVHEWRKYKNAYFRLITMYTVGLFCKLWIYEKRNPSASHNSKQKYFIFIIHVCRNENKNVNIW